MASNDQGPRPETDEGDIRVLRWSGELDMETAESLYAQAAAEPPGERLILDLSQVTFMDSMGLNALLRIRQERQLVIAGQLHDQVRHVLEITEADTVLTFLHPSTEARAR
ncbi:STAS domain-containing protein [Streptomyces sp. NPDC002221]|uniref:STAS domain-containing protein n=1 Tax=Streptomyces sp. NPDC002221 TaxID=3364639 RepID=UPI0036C26080